MEFEYKKGISGYPVKRDSEKAFHASSERMLYAQSVAIPLLHHLFAKRGSEVQEIKVVGSVANWAAVEGSDIDLQIKFDPSLNLNNYQRWSIVYLRSRFVLDEFFQTQSEKKYLVDLFYSFTEEEDDPLNSWHDDGNDEGFF